MRASISASVLVMLIAGATPAAAQDSGFLSANLFGDQIVGGGDDDASADWNAEVFPSAGRLCYFLDIVDLPAPTGVAIHRGAHGEDGEAVIALDLPGPDGDEVCVEADPALLAQVMADPADFYVLITSRRHASGAVRGQLSE
jgi:hypothetical protein